MIIGGYAVNLHGVHRATKDIDVWVSPDPKNARLLYEALIEFGFPGGSISAEIFQKPESVFVLGRPPWRVDLLTGPSGVEFEECYIRRVEVEIEGLTLSFIGYDDLLKNKSASRRTRDLADIEALEKAKKYQSES